MSGAKSYVLIHAYGPCSYLTFSLAQVLSEFGGKMNVKDSYPNKIPDWVEYQWADPRLPAAARIGGKRKFLFMGGYR